MRLTFASLVALLLVPLLPGLPASAAGEAGSNTRVTAVVQDASGRLTFRHGHAQGLSNARALVERLRHDPGVVAASVDHLVHVTGNDDPMQAQQWGLTTLRATAAWAAGDASGQVVGIVDTGVDAAHPDLAGVVLSGTDIVAPGGDGRIDPNGHGTHVAGIVGARSGNGIGGAGLALGARILPVRVMSADGSGWDGDAAQGLVWATDHGARVVNMSFGGPDPSAVMAKAVDYALAHGVSVVVAAGNEGAAGDPIEYPAATPGIIAVGAVDAAGVRPAWSSTGPHLAVVAPGVGILSTVPGGGYATWSGTSMAAPFVSAAVALLRHAKQELTVTQVRQRLMQTADDLGPAGFDNAYGAGRVNLLAAEGVPASAPPAPSPTAEPVTTVSSSAAPTPAPTPTPSASAPAPSAPAVSDPTAAPVIATPPVMTARISASRTTTAYKGSVTVSGRVLVDGLGAAGVPVRLERQLGTSWVLTRTDTSGLGGLTSWVLYPDRTTYYRFVGDGWSSALLRIVVSPALSLAARRTGVTGRVLPGRVTVVRIDVHRASGWVALTSVRSTADGTYGLSRAFAAGTYVRTVAAGVTSPDIRVL